MSKSMPPRISRSRQPLLFVLEDDVDLAAELDRLGTGAGWRVRVVGSVEKALLVARGEAKAIRLALIDLMVPLYEEDLVLSRKMHMRRRRLVASMGECLDRVGRSDLSAKRTKLVGIDHSLSELIVEDGGLLFLEEVAGRGWLDSWKYAIFSATDSVKRERELEQRGVRKCGEYLGWIPKPVEKDVFVQMLNTHR